MYLELGEKIEGMMYGKSPIKLPHFVLISETAWLPKEILIGKIQKINHLV
jgi:hypothetical protein